MADTLDFQDIQGLIIRGYGNLKAACYVLLAISNPRSAALWLSGLVDKITNGQARPEESALNIALTCSGIEKLGLGSGPLAMFSSEFIAGIISPHRSLLLGDVEESSPERWLWGGPGTKAIDMVLMLFAKDDHELAGIYSTYTKAFSSHGLQEVLKLDTVDLDGREHFGFQDGISQPVMEGLPRSATALDTIKAGEFLLGYKNEYGLYTDRPLLNPTMDPEGLLPHDSGGSGSVDFGRNGSYLVFRQLRQDVRGFWQFLERATRKPDSNSSDTAARVKLAAQIVGRWPGGAPLLKSPEQDDPQLARANDFTYYQTDPYGLRCPIGAHIRRANPRDSLDPQPGSEQSIAVGKRHRILRRGREYGPPIDTTQLLNGEKSAEDQDRGLHFLCLNANISRQFEFIQHTWVNNPHFNGLYDDVDPLVGTHCPDGGTFTIQAKPVRRRLTGLPRFVSVVGGAYFFMPGIKAIRYLASLQASSVQAH